MKPVTLRNTLGFGLLALLICIPARAQQQNSQSNTGDPVADAARKAQEKKKDAPKPKKVYTDDDITTKKNDISVVGQAPAQSDQATAQQATSVAVQKTEKAKTTQEKEDPNSEKAWRQRFAALRERISNAERELDVLQREENKAGVQYYSDPSKALNEQYSRDEINKKAAKIEAKQKEIADLKQQWSDMEDQLRKIGGDPGWAR